MLLLVRHGDAVDKLFVADYALTASNGFDPFVKQADDAAALTPGVTAVSPIRGGDARVFDKNVQVTAVSPNLAKTVRIDWLQGGTDVPARLGKDGAFTDKDYAKDHHLELGSPVPLTFADGSQEQFNVKGIFAQNDEMALGAIQALGNKAGKVIVVGFDGTPDGLKAVQAGTMAALVAQQPKIMGGTGVEDALKVTAGDKVETQPKVEVKLVTKDNVADFLKA